MVNFLAAMFKEGVASSSLNVYRSAISSGHAHVEGAPVGQHRLVSELLAGAAEQRPSLPKYAESWDTDQVTHWIRANWPDNQQLSLVDLTSKLAMLLALATQARSSDLASISFRSVSFASTDTMQFTVIQPKERAGANQSRKEHVAALGPGEPLCPVACTQRYLEVTTPLRTPAIRQADRLLLITKRPHSPATAQTIANWNKSTMDRAGVDTEVYTAHSIRMASTSKALDAGVDSAVVASSKWASQATMNKHYNRSSIARSPAGSRAADVISRQMKRTQITKAVLGPVVQSGSSSSTTAATSASNSGSSSSTGNLN